MPSGVILTGVAGGETSNAEVLTIINARNTPLAFTSTTTVDEASNWLLVSPSSGTVLPNGTTQLTVQARLAGLSAAVRTGTVRLAFNDGTVRTISVSLVTRAGTPASPSSKSQPEKQATTGCDPARDLVVVFQNPAQGFRATARTPVAVQFKVVDCSGNPVTGNGSADVLIPGQGGTPTRQMVLAHAGNGVWSGTWTPDVATASLMLTGRAFQSRSGLAGLASGFATVNTAVLAAGGRPAAVVSSVYNAASYEASAQITPGAWVAVFGDALAEGQSLADKTPYPRNMIGTEVRLQDQPLPLFFVNDQQVNALIPTNLGVNERHQFIVTREDTQSTAFDVLVSDLQPGIFTTNQQGTGQAAVLIANTNLLAAPANSALSRPASHGEFIQIYCTGLGEVSNPPADGAPAASDPLPSAKQQPTVFFGDSSATPSYAGLAPGLVGVYQVNVQVPATAPTGDAVPLAIAVGNARSNTVTIAIQ
jgi:uncharacterized protein (TIGR03437 family)